MPKKEKRKQSAFDVKIRMFDSLERAGRINFLKNTNNNSAWGGLREEVYVITNSFSFRFSHNEGISLHVLFKFEIRNK